MAPYPFVADLHRRDRLQRRRCFDIRAGNGQDDLEFGTSYKKSLIPYLRSTADSIPVGKLSVLEIHRHGDVPRLFERTLTRILGTINGESSAQKIWKFQS